MESKERGIIFNGEMVRAILDGRKTQTRRVMKVQPVLNGSFYEVYGAGWSQGLSSVPVVPGHSLSHNCPFGEIGDRLWVRETFCEVDDSIAGCGRWIDYRATPKFNEGHPAGWDCDPKDPEALKWESSSQMPRRLSRITLEITDIRVERLNDMSENDARYEGCEGGHNSIPGYHYSATPHEHFHNVWTSIYGQDSWQSNPWVWVVEFKKLEDK